MSPHEKQQGEHEGTSTTNSTFNLIVVNSGDGLQYHPSLPDKNAIYPWLKRLWIRFDSIPQDEIFGGDNWFIEALIKITNYEEMNTLENVPKYFYNSVLANFKKYFVRTDMSDLKLIPAQRSGSCSLSSLMASFLYFAENDLSFHRSMVIIGHSMIGNFLEKYYKDDAIDPDFRKLISDGFEPIPRKLFQSVPSSLARQFLSYHEIMVSEFSKSCGMDDDKSKRNLEIGALNSSPEAITFLEKTVGLCSKLQKYLKAIVIDERTNLFTIDSETRKSRQKKIHLSIPHSQITMLPSNGDWSLHVKKPISRECSKLSSFNEILDQLNECKISRSGRGLFTCVLDTFNRSKEVEWWKYLDTDEGKAKSINFLQTCNEIINAFLKNTDSYPSLDNIVMLAHLQIGVWKSAVVYDNSLDEEHRLGLDKFSPPKALESVLEFNFDLLLTSSKLKIWPIRTSFSATNLKSIAFLFSKYKQLTNGALPYLGPADMFSPCSNFADGLKISKKILQTGAYRQFYAKLLKFPYVSTFVATKKSALNLIPEHFDYIILMIFENELLSQFKHYYLVMSSLNWIYLGSLRQQSLLDSNWSSLQTSFLDSPSFHQHQNCYMLSKFFNCEFKAAQKLKHQFEIPVSEELQYVDSPNALKINLDVKDSFDKLRHSQCFFSKPFSIINLESWLNYIKGASDTSIFQVNYFTYLSDRILNLPMIKLNHGSVNSSNESSYPIGITIHHIKEIVENFTRVIRQDLEKITAKRSLFENIVSGEVLYRVVDVAIIVVRFIGRVDYDEMISDSDTSLMLADIYNMFFGISHLKNDFRLSEKEVSAVNLVLAQICEIKIRKPQSLIANLKIQIEDHSIRISRRTLARYHWFISKSFYSTTSVGTNITDDLFDLGSIYYPIAPHEFKFMDFLLKNYFLPNYMTFPLSASIKYSKNGDIVFIDYGNELKIGIQLSNGILVINGNISAKKQLISSSQVFKSYFSKSDIDFVMKGEMTVIGEFIVYAVDDFKFSGNTIVLIYSSRGGCDLYRRHKNNWYRWREEIDGFYASNLRLKWTSEHKLYFRLNGNEIEHIVLNNDATEIPLFKFTFSGYTGYSYFIDIEISDFRRKFSLLEAYEGYIDRHLNLFTEAERIIITKLQQEDKITFIFPNLRLFNDPNRPLILTEVGSESQANYGYEVLNMPGSIVDSRQVVVNGIGIQGTLALINENKQRFLMVPLAQTNSKKDDLNNEPTWILLIPIVSDSLSPQTRLQRLLLAYYCVQSYEHALARKFLHPSISIHQNEPFSDQEIRVLDWISAISGGGAEADSLKLMAFIHAIINKEKFPLEYITENISNPSKNFLRLKIIQEMYKRAPDQMLNFLMSIRDISLKYSVFSIFPEILNNSNLFERIMRLLKDENEVRKQKLEDSNTNYNLDIVCSSDPLDVSFESFLQKLTCVGSDRISALLLTKDNLDLKAKYMNIGSKLIFRDGKNTGQNEVLLYCMKKHADKFELYQRSLIEYYDSKTRYKLENAIRLVYKELIQDCYKCCSDELEPFSFALNSRKTDFFAFSETIKSSIKSVFSADQAISDTECFKFVEEKDILKFNELQTKLESETQLVSSKEASENPFAGFYHKKSPVLSELVASIRKFSTNIGQFLRTEIDLSSNL